MTRFTERPPYRELSACGIAAMFNMDKKLTTGENIKKMISVMRERENGLGGGFAAYGLFPKYKDQYCIQLIMEEIPGLKPTKERVEEFLNEKTVIEEEERVPVNDKIIKEHPLIWRFFVDPKKGDEYPDETIKDIMMHINSKIRGAFCLSGGKNMAVFKGNGWAEEIANFYMIDKIKAYMWSAHSRFPTNTPGWWGGAHPFSILGHAVVHNGEITSYGTNVNYLEELGYQCKLLTDTEVLAYLFDFLVRKSKYPPEIAHKIAAVTLAPPYWREIDRMPSKVREFATALRMTHRKAMANGPFSIVITTDYPKPMMIGHSDRKKLRPLIAAVSEDENTFYLSSELNAIHLINDTQNFWQPDPGKPVIATIDGIEAYGTENLLESIIG
ncbi:MAG TPA: hypothetical protein EYP86_05200 [Candidatus Altiarchaeales archaeon]|nr:hypothetical protein [Candidatus Altiarchaeales archaeon]